MKRLLPYLIANVLSSDVCVMTAVQSASVEIAAKHSAWNFKIAEQ